MKVQELLDSEDKWTQYELARNKDEEYVRPNSPNAVKWCLVGAIRKCYLLEAYKIEEKIYKICVKEGIYVSRFNNSHSYEEVMELVKRLDL